MRLPNDGKNTSFHFTINPFFFLQIRYSLNRCKWWIIKLSQFKTALGLKSDRHCRWWNGKTDGSLSVTKSNKQKNSETPTGCELKSTSGQNHKPTKNHEGSARETQRAQWEEQMDKRSRTHRGVYMGGVMRQLEAAGWTGQVRRMSAIRRNTRADRKRRDETNETL